MGKNNRQRRAAKARKRSRQHRPSAGGGFGPDPLTAIGSSPVDRFAAAVYHECVGHLVASSRLVDLLAADDISVVAPAIAGVLESQVERSWDSGWQPTDLHRVVARHLGKAEAAMIDRVITAQSAGYSELGHAVAQAWMAQVDALGAVSWPGHHYLLAAGATGRDAIAAAVRLLGFVQRLRPLPQLSPPPSAWKLGMVGDTTSLPDELLDKVRALLAQAESTTFEAEAETFTAKAQELMARYRIDQALVEAQGRGHSESPVARRVAVDNPYADPKATLLAGIADANECRAVWDRDLGASTVFGFAGQIAAVEELFTSLLVQANAQLRREGSKLDYAGSTRTTRFRRSFMVAFAVRIGQRLADAVGTTVDAADQARSGLLPVLAARQERVDHAARTVFPKTATFSLSASDREGWIAGTAFGNRADLGVGPALARESA